MVFNSEAIQVAEMSVIGGLILKEKILYEVKDIVKPEDFYFSQLKMCYKAILELSRKGKAIDYVTVLNQATRDNKHIEAEIKTLLLKCAEITPSISNVTEYAKIIVNSAKARKLQEIGTRLSLDGVTAENAEETAEQVMSEIFEMISKRKYKKIKNIGDVGIDLFDSYINGKERNGNRVDTGFKKLDETLKGMSAGNLIILAARPKVGKTAFALTIAENVAKSGKTVAFFSLEMEGRELYERLLAKTSRIPMNTLIDKRFNDESRPENVRNNELMKISELVDSIYNLPIKVNDNSRCTVNDIRLECRMIKNLGLIVVDYLQLMKSGRKHDNRNQEVGAISRELKTLASELGVPILCLSQLNRTSDESARPNPSELRDSGEIEQNCSKLIMMWCIEKNLNEIGMVESKTVGVDVALNRRGNSGVTLFNFNGNYMNFTELDRKYEETKSKTKWRL